MRNYQLQMFLPLQILAPTHTKQMHLPKIMQCPVSNKALEGSPEAVVGMLIEIEGELALPRFGAESGIHRFVSGTKSDRVLVGSTDAEFEKFEIAEELAKRDSVKFQFERRIYDSSQNFVKDINLGKTYSLENADLREILIKTIKENLQKTADNLIE